MKEKSQIDEMRAVLEGDRRRALARLRAEGWEPLFPVGPLEAPAAAEPPAARAPVEEPPPPEDAAPPQVETAEPARFARLRGLFRRR